MGGTNTFTPNIADANEVVIGYTTSTNVSTECELKSVFACFSFSVSAGATAEVTVDVTGVGFNSLKMVYTDPQNTGIKYIKTDGKLLVDRGVGGDHKLVKETPYDTTLTVDGPTDLADMTGSVLMTDGTGAPGPYSQTPTSWSPLILKVFLLIHTQLNQVVTPEQTSEICLTVISAIAVLNVI